MAKNGAKDKTESPKFKKAVPVKLKAGEKESKNDRIVEALGERKEVKAEMKLATSQHRTRINELDKEIETLREQINGGQELREVDCVNVKDFRNNVVKTLRVDTRETIETREMTSDERQETFPALPTGEEKKRGRGRPRKTGPAEEIAEAREEMGGEA